MARGYILDLMFTLMFTNYCTAYLLISCQVIFDPSLYQHTLKV